MSSFPSISREAMRELDRATIEDFGLPGRVLMENAGRALVTEVIHFLRAVRIGHIVRAHAAIDETFADESEANDEAIPARPRNADEIEAWKAEARRVRGPVGIVCGPGNNGGDGLVAARTLLNHGVETRVFFVGDEATAGRPGDAGENVRLLARLGGGAVFVGDEAGLASMRRGLEDCKVVVDALFGTGLTRELEGVELRAVELLNLLDKPCIAADIPSGLDANTGMPLGATVTADVTVTFAVAKHGLLRGHGPDTCGRINVAEIGIPRSLIAAALAKASQ